MTTFDTDDTTNDMHVVPDDHNFGTSRCRTGGSRPHMTQSRLFWSLKRQRWSEYGQNHFFRRPVEILDPVLPTGPIWKPGIAGTESDSGSAAMNTTDNDMCRIGYDVGSFGRWFRLYFGLLLIFAFVFAPYISSPVPRDQMLGEIAQLAGYFLLWVAIYMVAFHFLAKFLCEKVHPWVGTAVFLGPPLIFMMLGIIPPIFAKAFGLYVGISFIVMFAIRYGGCEVVAIPTLVLKQKYTVYCPLNAIDAVERAATQDEMSKEDRLLSIVSLGIVTLVGGYFSIFNMSGLVNQFPILEINGNWALLLLAPAFYYLKNAYSAYRVHPSLLSPEVRKYGLGATFLIIFALGFKFNQLQGFYLWIGTVGIGVLYTVYEIFRRIIKSIKG